MIPTLLFMIAGIANAAMDSHAHHYSRSVWRKLYLAKGWRFFRGDSWKNKYIDDSPLKGRKKFFFGVANVPVAFTDLWHFMQSIQLWSITIAAVIILPFYDPLWQIIQILFFRFVYGVTFTFFYKKFG